MKLTKVEIITELEKVLTYPEIRDYCNDYYSSGSCKGCPLSYITNRKCFIVQNVIPQRLLDKTRSRAISSDEIRKHITDYINEYKNIELIKKL